MKIKHHIATEHAIYKTGTIFICLCVAFTIIVSIMSFGRYGYLPSADFFWAPLVLLALWTWRADVKFDDGCHAIYRVRFLGFTMIEKRFSAMEWRFNGKVGVLYGKYVGEWQSTMISIEKGNDKQVYLDKLLKLQS